MSVDLSGIQQQNYIGQPYAIAMQIGKPGTFCVPLKFLWAAYGASNTNQNIVVAVNLAGTTNQPRQLLQQIRSLYIDNTGSPVPIYVQFSDTGFTAVAQPYSAGWYPVFTNSFKFTVAGLGFLSDQIPQTQIFVTNSPVAPYTDTALQTVLPYYLASPSIGGGAGLASITPVIAGQDYANGGLLITGGGGNGATAHGVLDQFGRFIDVVIDNPGTGYTGQPVITPTAANPSPPVFNGANNYNVGNHVVYNGTEWIWNGARTIDCGAAAWNAATNYNLNNQASYAGIIYNSTQNNNRSVNPPPQSPNFWQPIGTALPNVSGNWLSSGTAPATAATFTSTLSVISGAIVSSGLALPALGDQPLAFFSNINALGVFANNLWGSPYNTGFIYLTHLNIECEAIGAGAEFVIEDVAGYAPYAFQVAAVGQICTLQRQNVKLDATQTWRMRSTVWGGGSNIIQTNMAWTYALI